MSNPSPDEIRADIERTRANLSANVNTLTEEVKPSTVAKRQVDKVKGNVAGLAERVMGKASDVQDTVSDKVSGLQSSASDTASNAGGTLSAAPGAAVDKAKGNPLVVGGIAFGVGLLIAGLIPTSQREQHAAAALKDKAQPLAQDLAATAKEAAGNLQAPAQEAAQSLKETATDAVSTVKDEGTSAAQDVKGDALDAKDSVQDKATS